MDDKITISLSPEQRDLLLKNEPYFANHDLFRLVSIAAKKGNLYEINLNKDQLNDLLDKISELGNNEDNEKMRYQLDDLYDYIEEFLYDEEDMDAQEERIMEILGNIEDIEFDDSIETFYKYLKANLQLPCEVTGIEDFQWEECYLFEHGDKTEYKQLKKKCPSYRDRYQLLNIHQSVDSEWAMCDGDDLAACVRRISDKKEFVLGLSELKATDKTSKNYELLDDYSVWFVNNA